MAKEITPQKRNHRTYRISDDVYFKAMKKSGKLKTTLSNILEDTAAAVAKGYDAVASLEEFNKSIAKPAKSGKTRSIK